MKGVIQIIAIGCLLLNGCAIKPTPRIASPSSRLPYLDLQAGWRLSVVSPMEGSATLPDTVGSDRGDGGATELRLCAGLGNAAAGAERRGISPGSGARDEGRSGRTRRNTALAPFAFPQGPWGGPTALSHAGSCRRERHGRAAGGYLG